MGSDGPNSAGTIVNDDSVGTLSWNDVNNAKTDDVNFSVVHSSEALSINSINDNIVRLVKSGFVAGDNKANNDQLQWENYDQTDIDTTTVTTYGSSSDLWGLSLTPSDINSSNFGFVYRIQFHYDPPEEGLSPVYTYTNYLKFSNFNLSVPESTQILGVELSIRARRCIQYTSNYGRVYYAEVTVYYENLSKSTGVQSVTGVGSITFTGV